MLQRYKKICIYASYFVYICKFIFFFVPLQANKLKTYLRV